MGVTFCDCEGANEQRFEIMLDPERFSFGRTRKSRRIENDGIKFFASPGEPRQHGSDIVRDKTMIDCLQVVQRKILTSTAEIFFGQVDVESARSATCRVHRKG